MKYFIINDADTKEGRTFDIDRRIYGGGASKTNYDKGYYPLISIADHMLVMHYSKNQMDVIGRIYSTRCDIPL